VLGRHGGGDSIEVSRALGKSLAKLPLDALERTRIVGAESEALNAQARHDGEQGKPGTDSRDSNDTLPDPVAADARRHVFIRIHVGSGGW
jgi:hypothetical protein